MNENNYRLRILLTVLCMLIAFCSFFIWPPSPETFTIKISDTKSISSTHDYGAKFFEWVGLLFIALSVWIWRRELKLTGFGPLAGEPLTQQTPEDFRKSEEKTDDNNTVILSDISAAASIIRQEEFEERKQIVLRLFKTRHALNSRIVARELGVSEPTAKQLLFFLIKEGKVRSDGFPSKSLYTLTTSPENLVIDHIRKIIEADNQIDFERRFVRVKRIHELDAIFESSQTKFLVEVKYIKSMIELNRLEVWLGQLLNGASQIEAEKIVCYLALVVFEETILESIKNAVKRFTYETGDVETIIMVLSKDELEKESQNRSKTILSNL
jgi:hypothetical protein